MSTVTENDVRELKDLINQRFGTLERKIEVHIAKTEEKLESITQNIEDLKKQSEKQDNRLWILVTGLFLSLFGFFAKFAFFPNP
ncbi:MAG: hypothetical protein AB4058_15215 [Microcystaceae cyanobacterium]